MAPYKETRKGICQTFLDLLVCLNLISMAVNKIKFKTKSETLRVLPVMSHFKWNYKDQ